jgi:hypothetical protein
VDPTNLSECSGTADGKYDAAFGVSSTPNPAGAAPHCNPMTCGRNWGYETVIPAATGETTIDLWAAVGNSYRLTSGFRAQTIKVTVGADNAVTLSDLTDALGLYTEAGIQGPPETETGCTVDLDEPMQVGVSYASCCAETEGEPTSGWACGTPGSLPYRFDGTDLTEKGGTTPLTSAPPVCDSAITDCPASPNLYITIHGTYTTSCPYCSDAGGSTTEPAT